MDKKQPYALWLAEKLQDVYNATYRIKVVAELRRQHAEIETLRAGYDAARLEIASLHTQMEAVGAGGMEPLRKRECLHQISEPAKAGWCGGCSPDNCGGCVTPAAPAQAGEYPAGTGNPEADRIIGRLASSDPDFDDCADAVALIHKLVAEIKGPDGFATWKDAAIADRAARGQTLRLLTQEDMDSLGRRAEGMDGNEWDQWVQEKFAQVNGLKVQGGSYEWDWE